MAQPSFDEVKKFNQELWPRFREQFATGAFTLEDAIMFFENHNNQTPKKDDYVIFKKIPENMEKIITLGYAYFVHETNEDTSRIFADHEFERWIPNEFLRICPQQEIKWRTDYNNFSK